MEEAKKKLYNQIAYILPLGLCNTYFVAITIPFQQFFVMLCECVHLLGECLYCMKVKQICANF